MITGCHFWLITFFRPPPPFIWTPRLLIFRLSLGPYVLLRSVLIFASGEHWSNLLTFTVDMPCPFLLNLCCNFSVSSFFPKHLLRFFSTPYFFLFKSTYFERIFRVFEFDFTFYPHLFESFLYSSLLSFCKNTILFLNQKILLWLPHQRHPSFNQ